MLDVVTLRDRPGAAVVPRTALDRPAPDPPSRLPGMMAMVAGVCGGLAGLWAVRRAGWEQWLDWFGGEAVAGTAVPPPAERPRRARGPVAAPQGRAIRGKVGVAGLMVLGLLVLAIGVPPLARTTWGAVASLDWPVARGTVTESRLRLWHSNGPSDSTEQVARVVFTYVVDGRRYAADTPEWTIIGAGWGADAEGVVARYPRGAAVPVRYDPANPYRAVLRPGPLRCPRQCSAAWPLPARRAGSGECASCFVRCRRRQVACDRRCERRCRHAARCSIASTRSG